MKRGIACEENRSSPFGTGNNRFIAIISSIALVLFLSYGIIPQANNISYGFSATAYGAIAYETSLIINEGANITVARTVVLRMNYSSSTIECRFSNEDNIWYNWESCGYTKAWVLSTGNGTKTVTFEGRDGAGNVSSASDTIILLEGAYDLTPPLNLTVTDSGRYSNSDSSFRASWHATDYESQVAYLYQMYKVLSSGTWQQIPISGSYAWQNAFGNTDMTITGISLLEGENYSVCVIANNAYGINDNRTVCSDGNIIDLTLPSVTNLNSSADPYLRAGRWINFSNFAFAWNAADIPGANGVNSNISAYSYLLDSYSQTIPDTVPEGNLGSLENEKSKGYSDVADGRYFFHVSARDGAGNWAGILGVMHYEINIDTGRPTIPFMQNPNQNSSTGEITFSWESSSDSLSGISGYYITIIRNDTGAAVENNTWVGNVNSYTMNAENSVSYRAKVKAMDNAGNIGLDSDQAGLTFDNEPPVILMKKPTGTVVNVPQLISLNTNEKSVCYLNSRSRMFDFTNSTHHEIQVAVLEGPSPVYNLICDDMSGNTLYDTINFTVDISKHPDSVQIASVRRAFYSDQPASFLLIAKENGVALEEISKSMFSIKIGGVRIDDFVLVPEEGRYKISFVAPSIPNNYTISFIVDGAETPPDYMLVSTLDMQIEYSPSESLSPVKKDNMAYSLEDLHTVGIASDSKNVDSSKSNSSELSVKSNSEGTMFIFVTKPDIDPSNREPYLKNQKFIDLPLPSFGYQIEKEHYIINTKLNYPDILITSLQKMISGNQKIIIRNNGLSSGNEKKINITIEVI